MLKGTRPPASPRPAHNTHTGQKPVTVTVPKRVPELVYKPTVHSHFGKLDTKVFTRRLRAGAFENRCCLNEPTPSRHSLQQCSALFHSHSQNQDRVCGHDKSGQMFRILFGDCRTICLLSVSCSAPRWQASGNPCQVHRPSGNRLGTNHGVLSHGTSARVCKLKSLL